MNVLTKHKYLNSSVYCQKNMNTFNTHYIWNGSVISTLLSPYTVQYLLNMVYEPRKRNVTHFTVFQCHTGNWRLSLVHYIMGDSINAVSSVYILQIMTKVVKLDIHSEISILCLHSQTFQFFCTIKMQWWSVTKYNYFVTVLKYIFQVSVLYWSSFILSNFYFYFTTFQSIRSYFLLHYIS